MEKRLLHKLDLNLLKVLRVLSEEQQTTAAAQRLHMTQPAVSRALSRLREHFNDELFVRTRHGLKPTEKGAVLCEKLPVIFDELENLLDNISPFDPMTHQAKLRIAVNPFLSVFLPAALHLALQKQAPNIQLEVEYWNANSIDKLQKGDLDFAIGYNIDAITKEISVTYLEDEHFHILVRRDHPLVGQSIKVEQLADYPMVNAIIYGWNEYATLLGRLLNEKGLDYQVAYRSESITSIAEVTARSDAVFPVSSRLSSTHFPQLVPLIWSQDVEHPQIQLVHYQHYRYRQSPYHDWLKALVQSLMIDANLETQTSAALC